MVRRLFQPTAALFAAFLAANTPQLATAEQETNAGPPRQIEIGVLNSDEMADTVMTVRASGSTVGIGPADHAAIISLLSSAKELAEMSALLEQNKHTVGEGQDTMLQAIRKLAEVKEHIGKINSILRQKAEGGEQQLLRSKYSDHDVQKTQEDDARALDVARNLFETLITFPECVGTLFEECLGVINGELEGLGLATIEIAVREKRSIDQEGYYKVVIITNELADRVFGREGNGIVSYPFLWDDGSIPGGRIIGVDGKWNCHDLTPDACCNIIKQTVPTQDSKGNYMECHIFVPYGGVGNPRRSDRVIINLSSDGRVHEAPYIS